MKLPQFTLRDLFWLVLVCALAVGWGMEHARFVKTMNRAEERLSSWPTKPGEVLTVTIEDNGSETISIYWPGETIKEPGFSGSQ
jgi:hypothetical protein